MSTPKPLTERLGVLLGLGVLGTLVMASTAAPVRHWLAEPLGQVPADLISAAAGWMAVLVLGLGIRWVERWLNRTKAAVASGLELMETLDAAEALGVDRETAMRLICEMRTRDYCWDHIRAWFRDFTQEVNR